MVTLIVILDIMHIAIVVKLLRPRKSDTIFMIVIIGI